MIVEEVDLDKFYGLSIVLIGDYSLGKGDQRCL